MIRRLKSWIVRVGFNLYPPYFGTGARIAELSPDWREVVVELPLTWRTRNYVGSTFGGSMYAAVDPIYMMMLIKVLGPEYVVWDKAASIRFKSPGTGMLRASFRLDDRELDTIRSLLEREPSVDRHYHVDLVDDAGKVHASVEKTVYIRRRGAATFRPAA